MKKRKITSCIILFLAIFILYPQANIKAEGNLLINGNAESEMLGWTDPDNLWYPSADVTPKEGNFFFWPSKGGCETSYIYQDVDVSSYAVGTWVELSGWLANWDQSPHDEAILQLEFLDAQGRVLGQHARAQRNPQWTEHAIQTQIIKNTTTARVKLIAKRYVGTDNDGYFDDLSFRVLSSNYQKVYVTGKTATAKSGDIIQLKANNGTTTNAASFKWSSSYDAMATVDGMGRVTFLGDSTSEVTIYAEDLSSGIVGVYYFNSSSKNESPTPKQVTGLKKYKATKTTITLKWTKVKNAKGYYVYQYNKTKKKWVKVKTLTKATTNTATIKKLKSKTSFQFKVVAYATYGNAYYAGKASKVLKVQTRK